MFAKLFEHFRHGKDGNGIVVGSFRQPLSVWRKTLIGGCLAIIVVSGVASYFLWRANSHAHKAKFNGEAAVQTSVLKVAASDDHDGKYDEEAKVLKSYLKSNPPQKYRYEPLITLGNLAYNKRDDAGAIVYYKEAVAAHGGKLTQFDAAAIAQAAQAAGDKAVAIQYYKQAIELTKVQPGVATNTEEYKQIIKHLGGTP